MEKFGKVIFGSWYGLLQPIFSTDYFKELIKTLDYLYKNYKIWPKKQNVFRSFKLTDYHNLKVVILGMDPYANSKANGLSFANSLDSGAISPSLRKIKEVIEDEYYQGLNLHIDVEFDQTLESWAKQGVLLINTALTVEEGKAGSHFKYWEQFTQFLLQRLSEFDSGVIYCLWGKNAQEYTQYINTDTNYVLHAEHPSYAARNGRKWDFSFKSIDDLTIKLNNEKIKW